MRKRFARFSRAKRSHCRSIETLTNLADCPSGDNHELTIYPAGDHNSWARTYDLSAGNDVYAWLLGINATERISGPDVPLELR